MSVFSRSTKSATPTLPEIDSTDGLSLMVLNVTYEFAIELPGRNFEIQIDGRVFDILRNLQLVDIEVNGALAGILEGFGLAVDLKGSAVHQGIKFRLHFDIHMRGNTGDKRHTDLHRGNRVFCLLRPIVEIDFPVQDLNII